MNISILCFKFCKLSRNPSLSLAKYTILYGWYYRVLSLYELKMIAIMTSLLRVLNKCFEFTAFSYSSASLEHRFSLAINHSDVFYLQQSFMSTIVLNFFFFFEDYK